MKKIAAVLAAIILICILHPATATACAVCYGDPQAPMTNGMNMAILSLLGITGGVLSAFVAFFVFLRKRARAAWSGPVTIEEVLNGKKG
ncbi:MAG: LPXTG cell wall anchor domain-containing protein [Candidatus Zixiibacteriota bacterium]